MGTAFGDLRPIRRFKPMESPYGHASLAKRASSICLSCKELGSSLNWSLSHENTVEAGNSDQMEA